MIPRRVDAGDINRHNRRTRKGIITVELEGGEGVLSWDERVLERDPLRVRIKTQFAYTWFQHLCDLLNVNHQLVIKHLIGLIT